MKILDQISAHNTLISYRKIGFKITALEETALAQALFDRIKKLDQIIPLQLNEVVKSQYLDDRNFLSSMLRDLNEHF
jgi:hypothetical protein